MSHGHLRDLLRDICGTFSTTLKQPPKKLQKRKEKRSKSEDFKRFLGGDYRTRICDLSRVRRALYQLS